MESIISLNIETGNSETFVVEDNNAAQYFWSNYYTNSNFDDDDYFLTTEVDLMGNLIESHYQLIKPIH